MEDNTTDDDGDSGSEIPHEAEGCGCGCNVLGGDEGLEGDEWGLEVGADADAGNNLEDDNAGPGFVVGEVDEEAETEAHENHAEPDWGKILACFFDHDADGHGCEREGEDEGEEIDAGEDWGCAENSLEVEWQEVRAGNEDSAMAEADQERCDVGTAFE